jgi:predicted RNase H-like nuclease (RuvC/YqgF family)
LKDAQKLLDAAYEAEEPDDSEIEDLEGEVERLREEFEAIEAESAELKHAFDEVNADMQAAAEAEREAKMQEQKVRAYDEAE